MRLATAMASSRLRAMPLAGCQLLDQSGEALAVFGKVDRIGRGAQDRDPGVFQRLRQLERGLPAKLHDHADQFAVRPLDVEDFQHVFGGQRLEIQAVRGVIVGRHGFGVAVDHDGLEPGFFQRKAGMAAAIVELDALADTVRTAAQDHDLATVAGRGFVLRLAEQAAFVGRVHIGRNRLEFGRAAVDALEHRAHAQLVTQRAHFASLVAPAMADDIVHQARTRVVGAADQASRPHRQLGQALVGKAHGLEAAHALRRHRQAMDHPLPRR
jgi:hypothetical protein